MNRSIAYALSLVGCLSSIQVQAKPPVALEPSSKWHVVYDDDNCRLERVFGEADSKVFLSFDQASPISKLRPTIFGPPVKPLIGSSKGVSAAFGESEKLRPVGRALRGTIGADKQPSLILNPIDLLNRTNHDNDDTIDLPLPTSEQLDAIQHFKLARGSRMLILHTGPMSKALAALNTCTTDLVKSWGLDPAQQATLSQRPKPTGSPGVWIRSADYPTSALRGGKSASIAFRLTIDITGKPSSCKIQKATDSPEFIKHTCDLLMRRARFSPALDSQGTPVASYYVNSVNWIMYNL